MAIKGALTAIATLAVAAILAAGIACGPSEAEVQRMVQEQARAIVASMPTPAPPQVIIQESTPVAYPTQVPYPTPVPTATPQVFPTPVPTPTAVPTATPQPTATPEPTPTPQPTSTPMPTPTATPAAYGHTPADAGADPNTDSSRLGRDTGSPYRLDRHRQQQRQRFLHPRPTEQEQVLLGHQRPRRWKKQHRRSHLVQRNRTTSRPRFRNRRRGRHRPN